MIEGLILEMLAAFSRQTISVPHLRIAPIAVVRARDLIHECFSEGLTLSHIAQTVQINPTYLAKTFRKYYGCSVGEYVRRKQIEYATQLLTESDETIADIGAKCGFYDQSHFANCFRRFTRLSPSQFRVASMKRKD